MKAYVINMASSLDRRAHMQSQLERVGMTYELIEAVNGQELDFTNADLIDAAFVKNTRFLPGEAGCALSHIRAGQRILDDGRHVGLILEDDVTLPPDLDSLTEAIAEQMTGAEVVLLNFHTLEPCRLSRQEQVELPSKRVLAHPIDMSQLTSTGAYLLTREVCERMQQVLLPLRARADDWAFQREAGALDSVRCVVPLQVRKDFDFSTTIYYESDSPHAKLQKLARYRIPGLYQALSFRRAVIDRRWSRVQFVDEPVRDRPHQKK